MFPETFSNSSSLSEEVSAGSSHGNHNTATRLQDLSPILQQQSEEITKIRKKRKRPGNPDPDAEVVALSPKTITATNRFVCEVCNKGFQREQNLQLHRRGHNLPWKIKQPSDTNTDVKRKKKRVYVCPEVSCIHHQPSRAIGDLTGIKKHFLRKHGEKNWMCEMCSKKYAVESDWKAHTKICGTKEHRCDCGTHFSSKDDFITHRASCDAFADESARLVSSSSASNLDNSSTSTQMTPSLHHYDNEPFSLQIHPSLHFQHQQTNTPSSLSNPYAAQHQQQNRNFQQPTPVSITTSSSSSWTVLSSPSDPTKLENQHNNQVLIPTPITSFYLETSLPSPSTTTNYMSATALLQKVANVGAAPIGRPIQTQSVGHMSGLLMSQMGIMMGQVAKTCLSSPPQECLGFASYNSANQSAWQKNDLSPTHDFLGLAPADERNQMNGNVNLRKTDSLSYIGGVDVCIL